MGLLSVSSESCTTAPASRHDGGGTLGGEVLRGRGLHRQISSGDGEDLFGIARRDRAGNHPDLTAARIKVRIRPDARIRLERCR